MYKIEEDVESYMMHLCHKCRHLALHQLDIEGHISHLRVRGENHRLTALFKTQWTQTGAISEIVRGHIRLL